MRHDFPAVESHLGRVGLDARAGHSQIERAAQDEEERKDRGHGLRADPRRVVQHVHLHQQIRPERDHNDPERAPPNDWKVPHSMKLFAPGCACHALHSE